MGDATDDGSKFTKSRILPQANTEVRPDHYYRAPGKVIDPLLHGDELVTAMFAHINSRKIRVVEAFFQVYLPCPCLPTQIVHRLPRRASDPRAPTRSTAHRCVCCNACAHVRHPAVQVDTDGSGMLDKWEFEEAVGRMGMNLSQEQQISAFKTLDADHGGTIEIQEFMTKMRRNTRRKRAETAGTGKALVDILGDLSTEQKEVAIETSGKRAWDAAVKKATIAMWSIKTSEMDPDEQRWRREEAEARVAEMQAEKEEEEAKAAEAVADKEEQEAIKAEAVRDKEEQEAREAVSRAEHAEYEAKKAIEKVKKEEEEAMQAERDAVREEQEAHDAMQVAEREESEAVEADKIAMKEEAEARQAMEELRAGEEKKQAVSCPTHPRPSAEATAPTRVSK